ncbi:MAG: GtrA family protein [Deltaproteobacteria bacterium]|nr:GtrA family protein [Deltaproteobacteria bacterium]MBW2354979.1 GtrA family protein [Deltaproteobacteria bacterium]
MSRAKIFLSKFNISATLIARIRKFLIVGFSAAALNLGLMMLFVELLGFTSFSLKNIANILSMEISIAFNFTLSRLWTWDDAPKRQGRGLAGQFIAFNLAALTGVGIRTLLFPSLELLGIHYILNVCLGIGTAAVIDFILYDRIVFRRKGVSLVKEA